MKTNILITSISLLLLSCVSESMTITKSIKGLWVIDSVWANDSWGGTIYSRKASLIKHIKFSPDGKFYTTPYGSYTFTFVGYYQVVSDSILKITQDNPVHADYPTYTLAYKLGKGNSLVINYNQFEGIVREEYSLVQK